MNLKQLSGQHPEYWAALNPVEEVDFEPLSRLGIALLMKREDRLDARLSGNKLYKLYGHLQAAQRQGARCLISFGGYYSNHLHALAFLGKALNLRAVGCVRGHCPESLSITLQDCLAQGMELEFLGRQEFRALQSAQGVQSLRQKYPEAYVIPEGGGEAAGRLGCEMIMSAVRRQTSLANTTVCVPCGTGTTLAGMLGNSLSGESFLGFSALKLGGRLQEYKDSIARQVEPRACGGHWDIVDEHHFGGFARVKPELFEFMKQFEASTGVLLDPVYTAKLVYSVTQLAQQGYWSAGHRVLVVHTGGLQGRRGHKELMSIPDQRSMSGRQGDI
ncbi:pyridoxal-phosphate dependent enzyme [Aestuariicella hydrocarbonica]|uniref:Pyridoxal-phosphate dependent enzyme n=1 Tax=Pseudomaricurvus hydrocarbonicus TaxID=1470433 RepID=A0A9E5JVH7_9GAMM|nr:pyridoxal-phosphate dependent enzyme [Aestuariicella hydrocarbonica]NHO65321.1 pyridoxal-phosphate dependent enzyme [Aestuariicella hydrocarbonica]